MAKPTYNKDGERVCPDCKREPTMFINGRCPECHEASCRFPLYDSPIPPAGFDPLDAGESWDDDY